jgi:predicted unusual protein kinase regulating ubiquinone biosynthesis (AarF/ABC1/UbiB family)
VSTPGRDRDRERLATFARAAARRFLVGARRLFTTEPGTGDLGEAERAGAAELARSAGELRGGMAKVAQLMAYLEGPGAATDADARRALGALWDQAPGVDPAAIRRVVEEDLGAPPEALFASWDDAPLAAASLGQVHAATAKDGARLAVKVQYPGVAEALRSDLESPRLVRRLTGSELGGALAPEAVDRLRDAVRAELDYVAEGRWLARFRTALLVDRDLVVPRPWPALSSARVLTAERIDGQSLAAFAASAPAEARARVAQRLFRFAWGVPLQHRLLNADPNPGNYLVQSDGRVAFLDFGCAVELDEELVARDRRLWAALLARDGEALRFAVHEEGLLGRAQTLDSSTYRDWERYLAGPFLAKGPFRWTRAYARRLAELTSQLVRAGGLTLPANGLLLWRQRLGVAAVLGELDAEADFGDALRAVVA